MSKKRETLTIRPKECAPLLRAQQKTIADLELDAVERSRAYIDAQLMQFKALRRAAGFED